MDIDLYSKTALPHGSRRKTVLADEVAELLGLDRSASQADIKKAYRKVRCAGAASCHGLISRPSN